MEFVLRLLGICFLLVISYMLVVCLVQSQRNCSTKEAKQLVVTFIKDCISTPKPILYYPVFIGVDEHGFPHSDIIETEFNVLKDIFNSFFFYNCGRLENRIWYSFKVSQPLQEMEEYDLIQYCENLCDTLVHQYMHKKNPSVTHVNNLVYVHYQENILTVYIAITDKGTFENFNAKSKQREIYLQPMQPYNDTITESWSDK